MLSDGIKRLGAIGMAPILSAICLVVFFQSDLIDMFIVVALSLLIIFQQALIASLERLDETKEEYITELEKFNERYVK